MVVYVVGDVGCTIKPCRIFRTAWLCRFTRRRGIKPKEAWQGSICCSLWLIAALAVLRSSDVWDVAHSQRLIYLQICNCPFSSSCNATGCLHTCWDTGVN